MIHPALLWGLPALLLVALVVAIVGYSSPSVPRPPKVRAPGGRPWRSSGTGM